MDNAGTQDISWFGVGSGNQAGAFVKGIGDINGDGMEESMTCIVSMKTCFVLYGREKMTGSYRLDEMTEVDGFRISLPDME